ncbi:MAG TPA: DUF2834 domain-containing protein [Pyrinomonadaceae bacterium]|nr:DUF2834 domain-containing protein [Pyrinomonadaceae bacterium]
MQWLYLVLAILGALLPLSQLFQFLAEHGFDVPLLHRQLFQSHISAFFGLDVIVSSFVLWVFVYSEGRRRRMKNLWLYVLCNLTVGVSLALPLFLFFRERKLDSERRA